jgi:hypothetical protein
LALGLGLELELGWGWEWGADSTTVRLVFVPVADGAGGE